MRKVHVKTELDVLVHTNDNVDLDKVMQDLEFSCIPCTDGVGIIDIQVISTEVTSSRLVRE